LQPEDLITYCGHYGGNCSRWCENTVFRDLSKLLLELADAHGYEHWMPSMVSDFDYNEFRKGLDFFSKKNSWLICFKCCQGEDGRPDCPVRDCCRKKGVALCFDCDDFPCDMVKDDKKMIARAEEYKKLGKERWLKQEVEKAKKGFELHSGKYYSIRAKDKPPPDEPHKK